MNEEISPTKIYVGLIPKTIIGNIWVAGSNTGLLSIDFDLSEAEFIEGIQKKVNAQIVKRSRRFSIANIKNIVKIFRFSRDQEPPKQNTPIQLKPYIDQIQGYLEGSVTKFDLPIDLTEQTPFQRKVLQTTMGIQFGQTITYAELAKRVGQPTASRAVGQALKRNPVPIVIPCHRVLHSDGTLGGYGGVLGSERKIALLKLEGSILA